MWGWISYDPELDLIYYGTANPGPWNPELRPGDNKWTCTLFARRPDTGEAVWAYQHNPHDLLRLRRHQRAHRSSICRSTAQTRKVLVHPERNGYIYVHRSRRPARCCRPSRSASSTRATGVDLKTGRLQYEAGEGAADRQGRARHLSRRAGREGLAAVGLLAAHRACSTSRIRTCAWTTKALEVNYIAGTPYVGANVKMYAGPGRQSRRVQRVGSGQREGSLVDQGELPGVERRARHRRRRRVLRHDGRLVQGASNARTGELLWQFKTGSGIIGQPMTYKGPDGKQYVAVLSGVGGWAGAIVAGGSRCARSDCRARLRQRDEATCRAHRRREACSTCSRCHEATTWRSSSSSASALIAAARSRQPRRRCGCLRALCACAPTRTTCRSRISAAKASRTASPTSSRASCTPASSTPGGRSAAASSGTRSRPALCDVVMGVPAGFERTLVDDEPYYRSTYVFVTRRDRRLRPAVVRRSARCSTLRDRRAAASATTARTRRRRMRSPIAAWSTNLVGFTVYGDYATPNPPARIVEAVARRRRRRGGRVGTARRLLRARQSAPLDSSR